MWSPLKTPTPTWRNEFKEKGFCFMMAQHFTPLCADIDRELSNLKQLTIEAEETLARAQLQRFQQFLLSLE